MTDWKREPLVHFLLLGALLFALGAFLGGGAGGSRDRMIVVSERDVEWLSQAWQRQWRRPPTEEELAGLIDNHIREEVLYREALAMGLAENDTIIRRRLVQKIEFMTEDLIDQVEPTEDELGAYFEANPDDYRIPELRSFTHIYFSEDSRGEAAWSDAQRVLDDLSAMPTQPDRAPELGDRFMMQYDYPRRSQAEVAQHMGRDFAEDLFALTGEGWQGPLRSGYGIHLVRVAQVSDADLQELDEVRDDVRSDLMRQRRETANASFYDGLRSQYEVTIDVQNE